MLKPRVKITFTSTSNPSNVFTFLKGFETNESYEMLTDKCTIVLPRKYQTMQGQDLFSGLNPIFKRGDKFVIESGYFPNIRTNFTGYIRAVNVNLPITIECEDSMYLLKTTTFNIPAKVPLITKSKKGKYLKRPKVDISALPDYELEDLLNIIIPDDIEFTTGGKVTINNLRVSNATACEILEKLKEFYGLFSYFVGTKLYVGFAANAADTIEQELKFEDQVINQNDLYYKQAEEINIKVKCIGVNSTTNQRTEVEVGPDEGELRTYHYMNLGKEKLTELANERLKEVRYTGYFGVLETFLEPNLRPGDRVKLTSVKLPERNGTYLVKSVRRVVDVDMGGRQFLELGVKVA